MTNVVVYLCRGVSLAALISAAAWSAKAETLPPKRVIARVQSTALSATGAAGKTFRTGSNNWREIVLPDGSAVTMGPNSTVSITTFSFDPATGRRELQVSATG